MLARSLTQFNISNFSSYAFSTSFWSHLNTRPKDAIFGVNEEFKNDPANFKINLTVGAYKDDNGNPFILNCVKEATKQYYLKSIDHEYLPICGNPSFIKKSLELAYSNDSPNLKQGNIAGFQSISGTGALRIAMDFIKEFFQHNNNKVLYMPQPTWINHKGIAQRANIPVKEYRYFDNTKKRINIEGLMEDIENAPNKSIILLHACAHNPTGMDLTHFQWKDLIELIKEKQHFPLIDMAYQGFATGDPLHDSFAVREFDKNNISLALCQSYAKNFGLYGERTGCLSFLCQNKREVECVKSQVEFSIRGQYSSPPKFGSYVVDYVFSSKDLTNEWMREIKIMSDRIKNMRKDLYEGMKRKGSTLNWEHIMKQIGMFAYTGLTSKQVDILKKNYHIFLTSNGRISIPGLNSKNIDYVANAFHEVTKH